MNAQRVLCAAALSAGVALTSLVGVGAAVANAAGPAGIATIKEAPSPTPQPVPGPTLSHHDQKKLDKYLKKHPEIAVPNTGAHQ
ncbi:hypothetical protein [[Mycobacterium] nativiensis]|uniref:Secreted protein n=1 Tax=[Mycobacterium] nativiensis TaxID=2855503 RepID=A0ABU5XUC8_9MYCO|nr:hypothetical protein [Mycolicibacter sp. MYC340]MEB3031101.1 hypothetical protein [Mycolicibacter sp. MYC340]